MTCMTSQRRSVSTTSAVEKGHDRCLIEFWLYRLAALTRGFENKFQNLLHLGIIHPLKRGLQCLQFLFVSFPLVSGLTDDRAHEIREHA